LANLQGLSIGIGLGHTFRTSTKSGSFPLLAHWAPTMPLNTKRKASSNTRGKFKENDSLEATNG